MNQIILNNMDAIRQGVGRITGKARLGADIHDDLVSDAVLAILERDNYDSSRASAAAYCRMVAFQVALDKLRAMKRGGQYSGAYAGFGNDQLNAPAKGSDAKGLPNQRTQLANPADESKWLREAQAQIAEVLPLLSTDDRALWELMIGGDFQPATWANDQGLTLATAYVRANRLRVKIRELLAA